MCGHVIDELAADIDPAAVGIKHNCYGVISARGTVVPGRRPKFNSGRGIETDRNDSRVRCADWESVVCPAGRDHCAPIR